MPRNRVDPPPKNSRDPSPKRIERDAKGQFAASQADRKNSGLVSANPRVVSPDGRAPGYGWNERPPDPEAGAKDKKPQD